MAQLKIQTGDGTVVPGQETAEKQQKEQAAKAEHEANSLFSSRSKSEDRGPDYTYQKIRLHKKDEVNVYAAEQDERYALDPRLKKLLVIGVITLVVFVLACILPTNIFSISRTPQQRTFAYLLAETMTDAQSFLAFFADPNSMYGSYVLTILVTLVAGSAMALSGGIFQGSLKNALASPSTLGVTSGGSIGAIIYALWVYPSSLTTGNYSMTANELIDYYNNMSFGELLLENFGGFFCSLLGCCIVVAIIMSISLIAGRGKVSNVALVVAGQVLTSLIALIVNWIRMWYNNHGDTDTATWLAQASTSSFTGAYTPLNVLVFLIPMIICFAICFIMASRMSLLAFKDEEARSMGISTGRTRAFMVAICTIMTALVISFCGPVGFVGFLVPHIARKLIGPDFKYLLPACALIGGLMVTAIYYIAQMGIPFIESSSTGIITSVIGSISFLVIALRGRRSSGGEWL